MTTRSTAKTRRSARKITPETLAEINQLFDLSSKDSRGAIPEKEHEARRYLYGLRAKARATKNATDSQHAAIARVLSSRTTCVPSPLDGDGRVDQETARQFLDRWMDFADPSLAQARAVKAICGVPDVRVPDPYDARLVGMLIAAQKSEGAGCGQDCSRALSDRSWTRRKRKQYLISRAATL